MLENNRESNGIMVKGYENLCILDRDIHGDFLGKFEILEEIRNFKNESRHSTHLSAQQEE